eukprot:15235637-Alexandrium_andersonii.AAC.1
MEVSYADRAKLEASHVSFSHQGRALAPSDTPLSRGLAHRTVIDAYVSAPAQRDAPAASAGAASSAPAAVAAATASVAQAGGSAPA